MPDSSRGTELATQGLTVHMVPTATRSRYSVGLLRPPRRCLAPVALIRLPVALILLMVEIRMGTPHARNIYLTGSRRSGQSLHRVGHTMSTALRMSAGLRAWWLVGVMHLPVRSPPVSLVPTPLVELSRPARLVLVVLVAHPPVPVLSGARMGASVGRWRPMARLVPFLLVILVYTVFRRMTL